MDSKDRVLPRRRYGGGAGALLGTRPWGLRSSPRAVLLLVALPTLKARCEHHEYEELWGLIGRIAGDISLDILRKVFDAHPFLERAFDGDVDRDGLI